MAQRQVSPGRKVVFYFGVGVTVVGFLVFLSAFFSAASGFGNSSTMMNPGGGGFGSTMMFSAVVGMVMMIVGGIFMRLGRMGLAGSGMVLDPEGARRDVEPWARMAGGVVKDAIDEAGVRIDGTRGAGEGDEASSSSMPFDERLRRLEKLRAEGLVSESEYAAARKRILESV